jgi:chemotaxis signal transduction protein
MRRAHTRSPDVVVVRKGNPFVESNDSLKEEDMRHLLPLEIQSVSIAIDVRHVQEILGQRPWVLLPGARPEIPGVVSWRGRAVGLFDFAAVTEGIAPLDEASPRARTVIVQAGSTALAIPVDAVREVREVSDDALRAPKITSQKFSPAEIELDGVVMPLFDFASFIESLASTDPASSNGTQAAAVSADGAARRALH